METFDCIDVQHLAAEYIANLLQVHDRLKMAAHLTLCEECMVMVQSMRENAGT